VLRRRRSKILAVALSAFALTFGVSLVLLWPRDEECVDDSCAIAFAAVLNWSLGLGVLVGAVAAFVAHALLKHTDANRRF
jgi:hypothetical protein